MPVLACARRIVPECLVRYAEPSYRPEKNSDRYGWFQLSRCMVNRARSSRRKTETLQEYDFSYS